MKLFDKKLVRNSILVLFLSGISLFLLEEFFTVQGDYGERANPWIDEVKLLHHLSYIFYIFCFGKVFNGHIILGLKKVKKDRFHTGKTICLSSIGLILTGCLLYYITNEEVLEVIELIHLILGILIFLSFLAHKLSLRGNHVK